MSWKDRYAADWAASSEREKRISGHLSRLLGVELKPTGIGAGSADRVEEHAAVPGMADYASPCGRLHIEVTGPLRAGLVSGSAPLWVRPDKLAAAAAGLARGDTTVIVHHLPGPVGPGICRYLVCDAAFLSRWRRGSYDEVTAYPRGAAEDFVAVPAGDGCVRDERRALAAMRAVLAGADQGQVSAAVAAPAWAGMSVRPAAPAPVPARRAGTGIIRPLLARAART